MRRYRLGLDGREFVIDVQEIDADHFEVVVGEQTYQVTLSGDEDLPDAVITPGMQSAGTGSGAVAAQGSSKSAPLPVRNAPVAPEPVRRVVQPGGAGSLNAPMPGVILELHVKAGDVVTRGQQIAVLDAMKMHNFIGAPCAGTIVEVCVSPGQAVGHGDAIVRYAEN